MPIELRTKMLVEGLAFPESPRWHDGRLWFSDMHACQVMSVTDEGIVATVRVDAPGAGLP